MAYNVEEVSRARILGLKALERHGDGRGNRGDGSDTTKREIP